jgi:acetyl esterase/lipase
VPRIFASRTLTVLRLQGWVVLAAMGVWLAPGSIRPSSNALVESSGVRLLRRAVESTDKFKRVTAMEIYFPPRSAVFDGASSDASRSGNDFQTGSNAPRKFPAAPRLRPAIIAIHGGSWVGGSPRLYRLDPDSTAQRLARAGLVVVAPEYKLASPSDPSWPEVLDELREVVRWVRRHAGELEIDSGRIAAMGQSAGAQLAALLGTLPDEPGDDGVPCIVNSVISFYGPSDLMRLVHSRRLAHEPVGTFLGANSKDDPAVLGMASPIEHVTKDAAPMLLLHGSDDRWVSAEQSVRLAEALQRAGVQHRLIVVEGARHGFEAQVNTVPRRDLLPEILDFLRRTWSGQATAAASGP